MTNSKQTRFSTKTVAAIGILCAIAFVAKLLSTVFPTVAGFLSFDLKDVVIVIGGFMLGPLTAAMIAFIVSLVEMVTVSTTGPIGLLMNVLASCSFACVAAVVYRKRRSMRGAIVGLVLGVLCMTAVMLLWNWLITPLYMKVDRSMVVGMLVPVFLPFNLVKGGINATLALLLYKPIVTALRKAHLISESESSKRETKWGVIIVSVVLLITFVLLALVLAGKL
ncbi:MAG: ECF transporter S component [Clostridia bacterium]|nr:ECF transporter S component [Clostridia bacterium]